MLLYYAKIHLSIHTHYIYSNNWTLSLKIHLQMSVYFGITGSNPLKDENSITEIHLPFVKCSRYQKWVNCHWNLHFCILKYTFVYFYITYSCTCQVYCSFKGHVAYVEELNVFRQHPWSSPCLFQIICINMLWILFFVICGKLDINHGTHVEHSYSRSNHLLSLSIVFFYIKDMGKESLNQKALSTQLRKQTCTVSGEFLSKSIQVFRTLGCSCIPYMSGKNLWQENFFDFDSDY